MCGIIGIYNFSKNKKIINDLYHGLYKLKNRGRDSYGYLLSNGEDISIFKNIGDVKPPNLINNNIYFIGLGQSRYATSYQKKNLDRTSKLYYTHPLKGNHNLLGEFYLVHNGNIHNLDYFRKKFNIYDDENERLEYNDTLLLIKIIEKLRIDTWLELLKNLINIIPTAYSLIIYSKKDNTLYLLKDRYGIRPLCVGENGDGYSVSSESNSFGNNYKYINEIDNGSIYSINEKRLLKLYNYEENNSQQCLFEFIYFMNKNSKFRLNQNKLISYDDFNEENSIDNNFFLKIDDYRYHIGFEMAKNENIQKSVNKNDIIVIGAPDTGIPSGKGFSEYLNVRYEQFIFKKPKEGRSFILEDNSSRIKQIKNKFLIDESICIRDKIVYFIDDSLVRGNTIRTIIDLLKLYKPKEIHIRIVSPKVIFPCLYGIDIPTKKELIMNKFTENELANEFSIKSIKFLKIEEMNSCISKVYNKSLDNFCLTCFTGDYIGQKFDF